MLAKLILPLLLSSAISAQAVNLRQDSAGYRCSGADGLKFEISANDTKAVLKSKVGTLDFEDIEFLDSAVLMRSMISGLIFQVREDGRPFLIHGELFEFSENACADQGFSKICSLKGDKKLLWSPEHMELRAANDSVVAAPVLRYGVYPNDGTYFSASNQKSEALHIVDFGAHILLLWGHKSELNCVEAPSL